MKRQMIKWIAVVAIVIGGVINSDAQELGVRFGNVSAGSVAIDGIFSTGDFSRIHADISFGDGVGIDVLWDFLYRPLPNEAFNWYTGAGIYMWVDDPFWFGVAGEIGLEYQFKGLPISVSADYRPLLSIVEETKMHWDSFGFNVRYVFGK